MFLSRRSSNSELSVFPLELAIASRLWQENSLLDLSVGILGVVLEYIGKRSVVLEKVKKDSTMTIQEESDGWYLFKRGEDVYMASYVVNKDGSCVFVHTTPSSLPMRFCISNAIRSGKYSFAYNPTTDSLFVFSQLDLVLYSVNLLSRRTTSYGELDLSPRSAGSAVGFAMECVGDGLIIASIGKIGHQGHAATLMVHWVRFNGDDVESRLIWTKELQGCPYPEYADLAISSDGGDEGPRRIHFSVGGGGGSCVWEGDIIVRTFDEEVSEGKISLRTMKDSSDRILEGLGEDGGAEVSEENSFGPVVCMRRSGKFIDVLRKQWGRPRPKELVLESFIIDLR